MPSSNDSERFDAYHVWLGIPPEEQPAHHYRLLGIKPFEGNPEVIENAADKQMAHLRTFQAGRHGAISQKILNEVAAAKICLLNPQKKAAYDQQLRKTSPADDSLDSGLVEALQQAESKKPAVPPKHRQSLGVLIGGGVVAVVVLGLVVWLAAARKKPAVAARPGPEPVRRPVAAREERPAAPSVVKSVEIPPAPAQPSAQEKASEAVKPLPNTTPLPPPDKIAAAKPAVAPPSNQAPSVEPKTAIAPNPPAPPAPGASPPREPSPKSAAPPTRTAPQQKLPVPDKTVLAQAAQAADALFKTEVENAATSADKVTLSKRLLSQALGQTGDAAGKYALMLMAEELAASAKDVEAAFQVVDRMAEAFTVDRFAMKTGILIDWAKDARKQEARKWWVEQAMRLGDEALDAGDLEVAKELGKLAAGKLSLLRDKTLAQRLKAYRQQITEAGKDSEELQAAREVLAKTPQDPQANLVVGQYLCFTKGDWEKGLPQLALGADEKLKGLARHELAAPPTQSDAQVAMADAWWEIAQGRRRSQSVAIEIHAGQWYRRADAALAAGLIKNNVQKRLVEVSKLQSQSLLPPPAVAPFAAAEAKRHQKQWADHLGLPVEETNCLGMPLALVPPGEFEMGSTPEQIAWAVAEGKRCQRKPLYFDRLLSETPLHRVAITRPFYLGTCPVTQADYEKLMGANPSGYTAQQVEASVFKPPMSEVEVKFRAEQGKKMVGIDTRRHPVDTVSWVEAMEFCRRLSEMPAERAARRVYRLPTEAEWEYACRAGTTTLWSSGDDDASALQYAWYNKNSGMMTHPVGEKKANAWGLFDMYGNVCQWCADSFIMDYYKQSPASDPLASKAHSTSVLRGGDALGAPTHFRSAGRNGDAPGSHHHSHGFRVAVGL